MFELGKKSLAAAPGGFLAIELLAELIDALTQLLRRHAGRLIIYVKEQLTKRIEF